MQPKRKMKPLFKFSIFGILAVGAFFLINSLMGDSGVFNKETKDGEVIVSSNATVLPDAPLDQKGQNVVFAGLPSNMPSSSVSGQTPISMKIMAWNSQMGLIYANGGKKTTQGSLMEKNGVNLTITRLDDCGQMQAELISFASDYKKNPNATGTNFIAIMGDYGPAWLAGANDQLSRLGSEYTAEIIYSCGRSLGEDQFMAPPSVKQNPQNARGMTCATVIRDGDWNIVVKWAADNGIPVNTDETTYNPEAINFIAASENTDASIKYNTGYTETRDIVKVTSDGKTVKTGKRKKIGVDMVAVWTPGDVLVAEGKGGLVRIVSTKEYSAQMPNAVIGIKKWNADHRKDVENFVAAISEGGDQVKSYNEALNKAGELSADVYGEEDGKYWVTYYRGISQYDKQGNQVELGGSRVNNLADNMVLYGMNGGTNTYASVYKVFGDIAHDLYPEYVASYPAIETVLNTSYIKAVANRTNTNSYAADETSFKKTDVVTNTVSKRAWSIEFETGSANFTYETLKTMQELNDQLTVAGGLQISIEGHTDATGSDAVNIPLSQKRANAVRDWLQKLSPTSYPNNRFISVVGKGSKEPLPGASNSQNRRVEIVLGN
jgi:outer membrane protein OmpA-like peptidoglycan-associated protein